MGRFFRREVSKVYWVTTIADTDAPTLTEINAGVNLTPAMADMSGFEFENSPIDTPDLETSFTSTIPGEDKASGPSIVFYDDDASTVIRAALAKGSDGYVVLMPYGKTATKRCEVWPATSTGFNDMWTTGSEAAKSVVKFAVTGTPTQDATVTS